MRTRIKELRKMRGLTLKELSLKVGTTPQTIQRLETGTMTVSMDWLDKIAEALEIEAAELITKAGMREIPFLGRIGRNGALYQTGIEAKNFSVDIPAKEPIAVQIEPRTGRYDAETILIGSKLQETDLKSAEGVDCLIGLSSKIILLRRIFFIQDDNMIFAPLDAGAPAEYGQSFQWLAPIVMSIRYF